MIKLFARLFIKDYENAEEPKVRQAYGILCGGVGIALNFLLCEAPDIQEKQVVLSHNVSICHDGTLQASYRKLDKECAEYPVPGWSMYGYELYLLTFATAGKEGTIRYSIETN